MRVTEQTKVAASLNSLNDTAAKQQLLAEQISSGKRVIRPSDDPSAADKIEAYKTDIRRGESITKDNNYNQLWLDLVDSSTNQMVDLLRQAKVKALEAANSYQTDESEQTIATEIESLAKDLANLANTKLDKVYLYSGSKTFTSPLLAHSPDQVATWSSVPNWWLSSKPITDAELKTLKDISKDQDLTFSTSVAEVPLDADSAQDPKTPLENKLIAGKQEFKFRISAEDTKESLVAKLNNVMAKKYGYAAAKEFPGGKLQDAYFYLGPEGKIGIQAWPNVGLNFSGDFADAFPFELVKLPNNAAGPELGAFGEFVSGFHERPYQVRITEPGEIGQAMYSVSDDGGATWSNNRLLGYNNEIFNPDGAASSKVFLNFARPGFKPIFYVGQEFTLPPNSVYAYQGNDEKRAVPSETVDKTVINTTGRQLFFTHGENTVNIFDVLERLKNNISKSDIPQINKQMNELDAAINQVLKFRAKSGVVTRHLQNTGDRISQQNLDNTQVLSDTQDLDVAKAATALNQNQIQQQAAMETTTKLLSPSLVQFLR